MFPESNETGLRRETGAAASYLQRSRPTSVRSFVPGVRRAYKYDRQSKLRQSCERCELESGFWQADVQRQKALNRER